MSVMTLHEVHLGVGAPSTAEVIAVARDDAKVVLAQDARDAIAASRAVIEALASDARPHYGVSTGFGALASKHIPFERRAQLQRSLVRSHAASSGPEVRSEEHTSELQSRENLVCRLLLEKKNTTTTHD